MIRNVYSIGDTYLSNNTTVNDFPEGEFFFVKSMSVTMYIIFAYDFTKGEKTWLVFLLNVWGQNQFFWFFFPAELPFSKLILIM